MRDVEARYDDAPALRGISLVVRPGEIVALIGPNGAGKTTLMRTIAGLHRPAAGGVFLDHQPIHTRAAHDIVGLGVVLVPEGRRLFAGMTVMENLLIGAHTARARQARSRQMRLVLEIFPALRERLQQRAGSLSGGQQQMVAIGRALMGLPRVLLLDEPSLGLAPRMVDQIFDVLERMSRSHGVTALLVEQNAHRALALAQRTYILEQGRVVDAGPSAAFLTDDRVREAYLGYAPARPAL